MLVFKGKPVGRVERRLHKNFLVRVKRYLLIDNLKHGKYGNNEKVNQRGSGSTLILY